MNPNNQKANALIHELSPYLLQHAYNPVHWRGWNDETLALAIEQNKPLFVSIGYATCHWCHVMEHESFEDQEIADLLNEHFIAVKVDREERPDIDAALMEMCQAMTGHGGWPLSIFMTPDKLPFFAGTYFPKNSIPQRIGFKDILIRINEGWQHEREAIISSGQEIVAQLKSHNAKSQTELLTDEIFEKADASFIDRYDKEYGGFGSRPKFPSPHHLMYLLRRAKLTSTHELADMAMHTLKSMANGGLHDQIGHGYHRYSTDREWLVPHFEKMLYDQAMILTAMTEAFLYSGDSAFERYAVEIVEYVQNRLLSPEGAWYCAEDADSEGEEGTYYLFTESELADILNAEEFALAKSCFHISKEGNYLDESGGHRTGKNIMSLFLDDTHAQSNPELFESIRNKCLNYREKRIPPLLDDKILTDWNGLMIHAMCFAGRSLGKPEWIASAEKSYEFITQTTHEFIRGSSNEDVSAKEPTLLHRYRNGQASIPAMADDYACLMHAAFELYTATGKDQYMHDCILYAEIFKEQFMDEEGRIKVSKIQELDFHQYASAYDGAIPSGASIASMVFAKLGALTGTQEYFATAYHIIHANGKNIQSYPNGFSAMLMTLSFLTGPRSEIVIAGIETSQERDASKQLILSTYLPHAVIAYNENGNQLDTISPMLASQKSKEDLSIFLCKDYACTLPVHDVNSLKEALAQHS
ncbi:MAG: hypothetical protein RL734_626 [Bacteroidota bacterium]|jgi:uncharacterized protein YyaL (SSP411 family)